MQTKEFLNKVCEQIKYTPIRKEISEELENHIEELKDNYVQEGMKEHKAEEEAIMQMGQAEEIGKRLNKIHKPKMNLQLLIITLILLGFGFLLSYIDNADNWKSNLIYITISIIPFLIIYFFDYKKLQKYSYLIYFVATIILLMPIIADDTGTPRSVTRIIAIPLYIIAFVGFIENISKKGEIKIEYIKTYKINVKIVIAVLSVISLMLLSQNNSNSQTLIVNLALTYYMVITAKVIQTKNKKHIKKLCEVTAISIIMFALISLINLAQCGELYGLTDRIATGISTVFNPEIDPKISFLELNKREAIKSAKLFGKADNVDIKTYLFFSEGENKYFPLIALLLNYGWIISALMIIMVISFNIKLIIDVTKIKDMYGKLLIIGIACSFIVKNVCCILINLNLLIPLKNAGIPFISFGKMDLLMDILSLAVIFSVYRRKNIVIDYNKKAIRNDYVH